MQAIPATETTANFKGNYKNNNKNRKSNNYDRNSDNRQRTITKTMTLRLAMAFDIELFVGFSSRPMPRWLLANVKKITEKGDGTK